MLFVDGLVLYVEIKEKVNTYWRTGLDRWLGIYRAKGQWSKDGRPTTTGELRQTSDFNVMRNVFADDLVLCDESTEKVENRWKN